MRARLAQRGVAAERLHESEMDGVEDGIGEVGAAAHIERVHGAQQRIQIAVARIAYLLLRALQQITKETSGFLELVRLVRANLMHRKDPTRLKNPPPPEPLDLTQLQLSFAST